MKKCMLFFCLLQVNIFGVPMKKDAKIYIAGHTGLVGTALCEKLKEQGYDNLLLRTKSQLDLRNQAAVDHFFKTQQPDYVFLAAARVGGIKANNEFPAQFIYDNLLISANIIHSAWKYGITKLLFLGSSCIYPRMCPQPIKEEYLLSGYLEKTNEAYAVSKIAGIKLCQSYNRQFGTNFIACMPTNLFGPYDNFDLQNSHVVPALIAKMHIAKINNEASMQVWGTGKPYREFLYIEDLADALIFVMNTYDDDEIINIGTGQDITVAALAQEIKKVVGFDGELKFDSSKPDGTPRKLLDVNKLTNLGWQARTSLQKGLTKTYKWFCENCEFILDLGVECSLMQNELKQSNSSF